MSETESRLQWWFKNVIVPLAGGGGLIVLLAQFWMSSPKPDDTGPAPARIMGPYENDLDRNGSDYDDFGPTSLEQCSYTCLENKECKAFTFDVGGAHCWLKNAAPVPTVRPAFVSAVVQ